MGEGVGRSPAPLLERPGAIDLALGGLLLAHQLLVGRAFEGLGTPAARLLWDGAWYLSIAADGYPTGGSPGAPPEGFQVYAFHPLYPWILRAVHVVTGVDPAAVAPWLSLAAAVAAVVALSGWLRRVVGARAAVVAVLALMAWPASPVLQMAYTEGWTMLVLVLCWRWLDDGRHVAAAAAAALLALMRPVAIPLAAAGLVVALVRWRRTGDPAAVAGHS